MFIQGIEDISKRLGPGRMASVLKKRCPGRFDFPSENEIRQAMSTLSGKQGKGEDPTLSSNRRAIKEPFLSTIQDIVEKNPEVKPAEAWTMFQEKHPDNAIDGYPEKKKFKTKFSSEKRKTITSNN